MTIVAKYEKHLTGNFDELLELVTDGVLNGSMSASYENGSDWTLSLIHISEPTRP